MVSILLELIANRLELVTDKIIGKQQNGFVKGRNITTNTMTTTEVVSYLNKRDLLGVIAIIDFEKCFDRIEHRSIQAVFDYFNFGTIFISMLMLLFMEIELCTINNGFVSNWFCKGCGINQGCPGSPLIYTYCGEILNHLISSNLNNKGVPMDALRNISSQFANDTTAFLRFEQLTIDAFGKTLQCIEATMGLKVSYEKTILYIIGSLQSSNARLYTAKNFAWSSELIETLGVSM